MGFVLIQLSDPHIGGTWAAPDPLTRLTAVVEAIRRGPDRPDAVVVSGDLADHGSAEEYGLVAAELASLEAPFHVVPGNHDDRRTLRSVFGLPGEGEAPVHYAADAGPVRLVMLDSTIPGEDRGDLGRDQLDWLETTLAAAPERATLLVMHHPPVATGIPAWDAICLTDAARSELGGIVSRHPQVLATLSGHIHHTIVATVGACVAFTAPSTYVQSRLDLAADELLLAEDEPPAFAVHILLPEGELVSHVQLGLDGT
jgi:3',5'-cyclic AMP phosphodiesterase CpdA